MVGSTGEGLCITQTWVLRPEDEIECIIDFTDPAARHNQVEQMLALHRQRQSTRTPHEQSVLAAQIAATDRQIDRLVYALYGLTDEESRIVEGG